MTGSGSGRIPAGKRGDTDWEINEKIKLPSFAEEVEATFELGFDSCKTGNH
jgi:hypothetical protein